MFAFLVPTLYIQISPERLTIRNPKTGASISEVPEMAIEPAMSSCCPGSFRPMANCFHDSFASTAPLFPSPRRQVGEWMLPENIGCQ